VPRVVDVARWVRDDELAPRRGEVAVGDVDRDLLLALGAEAVGQQREVQPVLAGAPARAPDLLEPVLEDRLRLVKEPPDQGALAVIDATGPREPPDVHPPVRALRGDLGGRHPHAGGHRLRRDRLQETDAERPRLASLHRSRHQKYPRRLRSSIAASLRWSSALPPRSVMRSSATSRMISSTVSAVDSIAPVHVASPTVRNRTVLSTTSSPGRSGTYGLSARSVSPRRKTRRRCAK